MATTAGSVPHCEQARELSVSPEVFMNHDIKGRTPLSDQTDGPYWCAMRATATGNLELRKLIGNGDVRDFERLLGEGTNILTRALETLENPADSKKAIVDLTWGNSLQRWREDQHELGRVLPSKGNGLTMASAEVIKTLYIENWPAPLLTNNTLFGIGMVNMLIGAHDAQTLFANICVDLCFTSNTLTLKCS
ncbi:uncharacterized protein BDW47DRAFT_122536 [Aspergillus candidus]|uniref:Uncharacterized protein n=1 Tax=Aspergillus candidus TaxID=41067 RepID=A0A2I2FLL5_ASPCN|nr:hypothetical protein BDW47DRAFT_122536 [Aspergillus candidus]PLB41494.1 hypothetical protein BDW47DRAFT_122536 [Aspergillus candidus]